MNGVAFWCCLVALPFEEFTEASCCSHVAEHSQVLFLLEEELIRTGGGHVRNNFLKYMNAADIPDQELCLDFKFK